jgi:predicted O-methyltransferase YrrM
MFGLGIKRKLNNLQDEVSFALRNHIFKPRLYDLNTSERIGAAYRVPSDMCETDRVMLYALVRGLRPRFALEIGVRWGGSARIIANAMEENGIGTAVGIDPESGAFRVNPKELHGRYQLMEGFSPQAIPKALQLLGTDFVDFVFIDALHTHDAVYADFNGCLPYLASGAHVLFHDAYHQGIDKAITQVIKNHKKDFNDLGFITRNPEVYNPISYQGLRLVRFKEVDSHSLIKEAYKRSGMPEPIFHNSLRNYDGFANRIGKGATPEELKIIENLVCINSE